MHPAKDFCGLEHKGFSVSVCLTHGLEQSGVSVLLVLAVMTNHERAVLPFTLQLTADNLVVEPCNASQSTFCLLPGIYMC